MLKWNKNLLAVDFSDSFLELMLFENGKVQAVSAKLEADILSSGIIKNPTALIQVIKSSIEKLELPQQTGLIPATAIMPDNLVKVFGFELDAKLNNEALEAAILKKVSKPLADDLKNYFWDYLVKINKDNKQTVMFAAVLKENVESYRQVALAAGLDLEVLDLEMLALLRVAFVPDGLEQNLIINFKRDAVYLGFADCDGFLKLSGNLPLAPNEDNIKQLVRGFNQAISYYEDKSGLALNNVFLAGEEAVMPGLKELLTKELAKPVEIINPLPRLGPKVKTAKSELVQNKAGVVGLSILNKEYEWPHLNLSCCEACQSDIIKNKLNLLKKSYHALLNNLLLVGIIVGVGLCSLAAVLWWQLEDILHPEVPVNNSAVVVINEPELASPDISVASTSISVVMSSSTATATITSTLAMAQVLPTPTGWLNVRQGPSASFPSIVKIKPGETYEIISEQSGWLQIKISAQQKGWASGQYLKKLKN